MYSDSRFVIIHGLSVHYRIISPDGTPKHRVLLLASPCQSTFQWRKIVPELIQAGCRCVLCDLPGFGLSECGDDVPQDHETRAQFLWGLLDSLDLEEGDKLNCWHLMAHGSACGTIAQMALLQPDSVSSLMMICPLLYPPFPDAVMRLARWDFVMSIIKIWMRHIVMNPKRFARTAARIYGKQLSKEWLERLRQPLIRLVGHEKMIQTLLLEGYKLDTSRLNDLFMPVMVLWGGRDPILGSEIPNRLKHKEFKTVEYHVLNGSAHCPAETNSRAVCDFLRGWIREIW